MLINTNNWRNNMPRIDKYSVTIYGRSGNIQTDGESARALIHLKSEGGMAATCSFYESDDVPDNSTAPNGRTLLNYPWSCYSGVLDLLRNEKPLYWVFLASSKTGFISTRSEPVGEGEED